MRSDWAWFALLAAVLAGVIGFFAPQISSAPFHYDEADYMYAGTRGFLSNFLDLPSQSLPEFVAKGLELSRDSGRRQSISEYIRSTGDITFYRHFHGPAYAYWLALCHALGVTSEAAYRGSGLALHAIATIGIFWLFRAVFRELPAAAAFTAAAVFAMNRTAIVAGSIITQHEPFAVLAGLALFLVAMFIRTGRQGYWYAAACALAAGFATVEIGVVLIGAVMVTIAALNGTARWKETAVLLGKGALVFLAALGALWPKGLLLGGAVKGFLYLGYMAVKRKTLAPIGPLDLWLFKIRTYPFEWVLLFAALLAAAVLYRKLTLPKETLPFLMYGFFFLGATMVITIPYTYYHCSMIVALAVVTGVVMGEVWKRRGGLLRWGGLAAVLASLVWLDTTYYREPKTDPTDAMAEAAMAYLRTAAAPGYRVFAPFVLIPTLHYYFPQVEAAGIDPETTAQSVAEDAVAARPGAEVFCPTEMCPELAERLGKAAAGGQRIGDLMWAYRVRIN